jgi:hypothetical protein
MPAMMKSRTWLCFSGIFFMLSGISCRKPDAFTYDYQRSAASKEGVVVSAHPFATLTGVHMLEIGGNAVDAAVAAPFPSHQPWLDSLGDAANSLDGIPRRFGTRQLREALAFLAAGNILYVAVDGVEGRRMRITETGVGFRMSTGFLRLAAKSSACVVPCHITATAPLRFAVEFGEVIPHHLIADPGNHGEAGRRILAQLLPILRSDPFQYWPSHLREYYDNPATPKPLWFGGEVSS